MRMILALSLVLTLAACAGSMDRPPPEPTIVTKEVLVEVSKPCATVEALGPEPAYPDTDEALATAPNLFEKVKLLVTGRILRITRLRAFNSAVRACN